MHPAGVLVPRGWALLSLSLCLPPRPMLTSPRLHQDEAQALVFWKGGRAQEPTASSILWVSLPASLTKSVFLLMIISNQNAMNKSVNSANKMQYLHQQSHRQGPMAFARNSPGTVGSARHGEVVRPNGSLAAFRFHRITP